MQTRLCETDPTNLTKPERVADLLSYKTLLKTLPWGGGSNREKGESGTGSLCTHRGRTLREDTLWKLILDVVIVEEKVGA